MDTQKPLKRSTSNVMIVGVCSGIAEWLGWDPTAVRVAYVLLSVFSAGFPGLVAYLILWVVMPKDR
ncbi:MAG: PspC domain-containing protein [Phycisphaerales bacterium]|nr:PspC domain-containing protein [Phycisphaerales bacterium]